MKQTVEMAVLVSSFAARKHAVISSFAESCAALDGDFWDVGCYGGNVAFLMRKAAPGKTIRLFDSFSGLPAATEQDGIVTPVSGMFATPATRVHEMLGIVHAGWVPGTFKGLEDSRIALAHIDLDLYEGIKASLAFIAPRLVPNGIIIVDDYGASGWAGVTEAVNEYLVENPNKAAIVYAPTQAVIMGVKQ